LVRDAEDKIIAAIAEELGRRTNQIYHSRQMGLQ
jgi:hypothetical protein